MLTLPNLWAGLLEALRDNLVPARRQAARTRRSEIARYANLLKLRHISVIDYYIWIGRGFEPWEAFDQMTGEYGAVRNG